MGQDRLTGLALIQTVDLIPHYHYYRLAHPLVINKENEGYTGKGKSSISANA